MTRPPFGAFMNLDSEVQGTDNVEILPVPLQQHPHSGRRMPPLTGCQVQCQALGMYLLIYPQTAQESETYSDPFSDWQTEAQNGYAPYIRSHSQQEAQMGSEPPDNMAPQPAVITSLYFHGPGIFCLSSSVLKSFLSLLLTCI